MKIVKVTDIIEKENNDYPLFMFRLHKKKYKVSKAKTPKKGWTNYPYERHYRAISTLFAFLFLSATISAQDISILLLNIDKQPIQDAVVNVDGESKVTDGLGVANFTSIKKKEKTRIRISHILYIELDTMVDMSEGFLTITLQEKQFSFPIIDISYKQSLYEKFMNIISCWSNGNEIYAIVERKGEYFIEAYNLEGTFLSKEILDERYFGFFHIQGSSRLHLLNNKRGLEIDITDPYRMMKIVEKPSLEYDNIKKIKAIYDNGDRLIFEEQTNFNKSIYVSKINTQSYDRIVLYFQEDVEELDNAKHYYQKIISEYRRTVLSDDKWSISNGIPQIDIVADGEWSGDLFDLAESNELIHQVVYFEQIIAKERTIKYILTADYLYFIDPFSFNLISIDLASDKSRVTNTLPISKNNDIFESEGNVYIVSDNTAYKLIDNDQFVEHGLIEEKVDILLITEENIIYYDRAGCRCVIKKSIE